MKEKVILAYSGGLDTTAIIPWLKETYGYDVVCVCIDVGQESELDGLDERAKVCGAAKLYIEDVIDEFCDDYIVLEKTGHKEDTQSLFELLQPHGVQQFVRSGQIAIIKSKRELLNEYLQKRENTTKA